LYTSAWALVVFLVAAAPAMDRDRPVFLNDPECGLAVPPALQVSGAPAGLLEHRTQR
jgi:hypothetical protein